MFRVLGRICVLAVIACTLGSPAHAESAQSPAGLALVIGQADHPTLPSPLADDDAALIATALAQKDFKVMAARNLDHTMITSALADFKAAAQAAPTLPLVVYLGGQFVQSMQDAFLPASDNASINPKELRSTALSVTSLMTEIAAVTTGPKLIIMDGARLPHTGPSVSTANSGLAIPKPSANMSVLLNQSPGMVAKDSEDTYQAFALAVSEGIRHFATARDVSDFVILRTFELSKGRQVPWAATQDKQSGTLFSANNPFATQMTELRTTPKNRLDATQGFAAALIKGSVLSYEEYNLIHIQNGMTNITRAVLAALRDSQIWQEASKSPSASGYWGYLNVYPRGLHANEARQALVALGLPDVPSQNEPLQSFATSPPTHDELALLSTFTPYRLDDASPDLATASALIRSILPPMADRDRSPPKPVAPASRYDLPLPAIESDMAARIKLPPSIPAIPMVSIAPEPAPIPKPKKPAIPLPPKRQSKDTPATDAPAPEAPAPTLDLPALFTITLPAPTPAPTPEPAPQPVAPQPVAPQPVAPKPKPIKPITDVFDQSFSAGTGESNLPY